MEERDTTTNEKCLASLSKKQNILPTLFKAAKLYEENLLNQNMLVVFKAQSNQYKYIEIIFEARHFRHLTGVRVSESGAADFYNKCLKKRISINDFELADDGTTILKSEVIEQGMKIHIFSKTVGDFNGKRCSLKTEKLVGNIRCTMGFVRELSGFFAPNTLLKADIRDEIVKSHQLMAVYMKSKEDEKYSRLCYVAKPLNPEQVRWNKEIESKIIDKENLKIECNKLVNKPKEDKQHKNKKKPKKTTT